jgi:hypothetical protein
MPTLSHLSLTTNNLRAPPHPQKPSHLPPGHRPKTPQLDPNQRPPQRRKGRRRKS